MTDENPERPPFGDHHYLVEPLFAGLAEASGEDGNWPQGEGVSVASYRVVRPLGRSERAEVFLARPGGDGAAPVALKLFSKAEAAAPSHLDLEHPGLARVHERGRAEDGRPFIVTDFVPGLPLDAFGDRFRLSLDERLRILGEAYRALRHAHHRGHVHGRLHAGNVLVASRQGRATPTLVDFGHGDPDATDRDVLDFVLLVYGQLTGLPPNRIPVDRFLSRVFPNRLLPSRLLGADKDRLVEAAERRLVTPESLLITLRETWDSIALHALKSRSAHSLESLARHIDAVLPSRPAR